MKQILTYTFSILLSLCSILVFAENEEKKVLILSSYSPGEEWAEQEISGAKSEIDKSNNVLILSSSAPGWEWGEQELSGAKSEIDKSSIQIDTYVEYMDTQKYSLNQVESRIYEILSRKYKNVNFDAIIALDNNALEYMIRHEKDFKNIPVFFAGINNFIPDSIKGNPQYTGVLENLQWGKTLQLILDLHSPKLKQIIHVIDLTEAGQFNKKAILEAKNNIDMGSVELIIKEDWSLLEIDNYLVSLPTDGSVALIVSDFFRDNTGKKIRSDYGTHYIDKFDLPRYIVASAQYTPKVVGGIFVDAFKQGVVPGSMVVKYLKGTPLNELPVVMEAPTSTKFNHNILKKYNIDFAKLPTDSEIVKTEIYKHNVLEWVLYSLVISILIYIITIGLRRKKSSV